MVVALQPGISSSDYAMAIELINRSKAGLLPQTLPVSFITPMMEPGYVPQPYIKTPGESFEEKMIKQGYAPGGGEKIVAGEIETKEATGDGFDWGTLIAGLIGLGVGLIGGGTLGTIVGGGAKLLTGGVGGGGAAGVTSIGGVPLVGPGVTEPPAQYVINRWETRVYDNKLGYVKLNFYHLTNGIIAMYHNERGYWKWWKPKKPLVLGSKMNLDTVVKMAKKIDNVLLKVERRTKKYRSRVRIKGSRRN